MDSLLSFPVGLPIYPGALGLADHPGTAPFDGHKGVIRPCQAEVGDYHFGYAVTCVD